MFVFYEVLLTLRWYVYFGCFSFCKCLPDEKCQLTNKKVIASDHYEYEYHCFPKDMELDDEITKDLDLEYGYQEDSHMDHEYRDEL